ncbi:unnamed protein product [Arctogadus glacialis]
MLLCRLHRDGRMPAVQCSRSRHQTGGKTTFHTSSQRIAILPKTQTDMQYDNGTYPPSDYMWIPTALG